MKKILAMQPARSATSADNEGQIDNKSSRSPVLSSIDDLSPRSGPSSVEFKNVFFSYPSHCHQTAGVESVDNQLEDAIM
ncbi:hypothetical protein EON65_37720, partial [archaeon]